MEGNLALILIALIGLVGLAIVVIGIVRLFIRLIPEKSRGIVIWTVSTVVIYLVFVGIPFALAIFFPDNRGLWVLVALGANLWCLGLVYLVYQLFRREPNASNY